MNGQSTNTQEPERKTAITVGDEIFDNEDIARWPFIPSLVPERPLEPQEQAEIEETIRAAQEYLRGLFENVDKSLLPRCYQPEKPPNYYLTDDYSGYALLRMIFFEQARTPEQVRNMTAGFVLSVLNWMRSENDEAVELKGKIPEKARAKLKPVLHFRSPEYDIEHNERHRLHFRNSYITASSGHWPAIRSIRAWDHIEMEGLNRFQARRYSYEPNHDCLNTIVSDTQHLFARHNSPRGCGGDLIERKIPENKRMTPAKLARFMQFPIVPYYIVLDAMMGDEALASNLTILAEYFCENDDVIYRNEISDEEIEKWMKGKFEKYKPTLAVATYVWARFLGTQFEERVSVWVEQYILDMLEKQTPWIFELAGKQREEAKTAGSLFEIYSLAIAAAEQTKNEGKIKEILWTMPAKELMEASMASRQYKGNEHITGLISRVREPYVYLPGKYSQERFENDFDRFCFDLFREGIKPIEKWEAIEGFELLDPMAIDGYSNARGWEGLTEVMKRAVEKIKEMRPRRLLRFKIDVVDKLPEPYRKKAQYIISDIAEKMTAQASFKGYDTGTLADIAMGQKEARGVILVVGEGVRLEEFLGKEKTASRMEAMAERAVLERHLSGARGGQQIIDYLLAHRGTMVPVDLVVPNSDAPNLDIIREFGESPDLLTFLTIATLLGYLKGSLDLDNEKIMREIKMLAELAEAERHPDLTFAGAENEMIGSSPEGRIVQDRYSWIFNVLAKGGDVNEIKTPPGVSTLLQKYLFALITDPRCQFLNAQMLWQIAAREDRAPTSIHLNISVPKELPFSADLVAKYMAPIQDMQWLANGGKHEQTHIARGRVIGWKSGALLDVIGDKNEKHKVEFRNLSLDEKGDYGTQIEMLQLISSAAIQFMREKAGIKLSQSGKIMAQIYERFVAESKIVLQEPNDKNVRLAARTIIEKFSEAIRAELSRPRIQKKNGIILVNN